MKHFKKFITNHSKFIVVVSFLLLIPAMIGYYHTKINYNILVYLPEDIETIEGQNILTDDFGIGAFSFVMVDNMSNYDLLQLEDSIREIDAVNGVMSLADVTDTTIPIDMLPSDIVDKLYSDKETVMVVTFETSISDEKTMEAVKSLRQVVGDATSVSGMSAMVLDTMDLSEKETVFYVVIAVILCMIVLTVATDSYFVPILLLGNIGVAILYNMGTNVFLGEVSYITKAISAVLQLGVTTDFSIFLYHKYEHAKKTISNRKIAMEEAMKATFKSVMGSSLTTIAGFLALCSMNFTLGRDIGVVMAKGVVCGLFCVLTLLPALLLVFDKFLEKTKHKVWLPQFKKVQDFTIRHYKIILIVFILLLIPAWYGNKNVEVYYKLDKSLPDTLGSSIANSELKEKYHIVSPEIILIDKNISIDEISKLSDQLQEVAGIDLVLAPKTIFDFGIPLDMLPDDLVSFMENDKYQLILLNSSYEIASLELNDQIEVVSSIVKSYDKGAIIAGEGPLMKDLTLISDEDFRNVNSLSIGIIFLLMLVVLRSLALPILLVIAIEFAIFMNMSIAYYMGNVLPFIASIVIGTIQLGATIDYAILMSTKYVDERKKNQDKMIAIQNTLASTVPSIIVSACCFFAATVGVYLYSKIDMIGSICNLLSRGSIISMLVVVLVLPSLLLVFDKVIVKTTKGLKEGKKMKKIGKSFCFLVVLVGMVMPISANAVVKDETVYTTIHTYDNLYKTTVVNHLYGDVDDTIEDVTELKEIMNLNGKEKFSIEGKNITWNNQGKEIFYQGKIEKELPIRIEVKYYLDGLEMTSKEMIGKKGSVKIVIHLENTDRHEVMVNGENEVLYTPFVVTAGTILSGKTNSNLEVSNGKILNTGSRNVMISLAAPGLYDSLGMDEFKDMDSIIIRYDTTNYKENTIYLVATPKVLEASDLEVFDKLDQVYQDVDLLQANMNTIENGATDLEKGALELVNGSVEIRDNLLMISYYMRQLESGSFDLGNGIKQVIKALNDAQNQLVNGDIEGSTSSLNTLKVGNLSAIEKLNQTNTTIYQLFLSNGMDIDNLQEEGVADSLLTYKQTYDGNKELIYLLQLNNQAIDQMIEQSTATSEMIRNLLVQLDSALKELESGANTLYSSTKQIRSGVDQLYQGSVKLSDGATDLSQGTTSLKNGLSTYNQEGIKKLSNSSCRMKFMTNRLKALTDLSLDYKGFGSDNVDSTTFVSVIK